MTSVSSSAEPRSDSVVTSRIVVHLEGDDDRVHNASPRFTNALKRMLEEDPFPQPGDSFLHFTIVEELGRGGFARAYLAKQSSLSHRLVVLKISTLVSDEPQKLARLQHANIVPVYSVHAKDGLEAICMPFLGRYTLHKLMSECVNERGRFQFARLHAHRGSSDALKQLSGMSHVEGALWFVAQLAAGLSHSHSRGILHRDIKPANILFTDDGVPMLLDFNVSSESGTPSGSDHIGGTFEYMAPEHIEAFDGAETAVDERSDLYSLGVILYELLTGRMPHPVRAEDCTDRVLHGAMIAARHIPPPKPSSLSPDVSPAVDAIVLKLLEPERAKRYRRADELHDDLTRQLANQPLKHARERSVPERVGKWRKRHPRLATGLAVAVVALFALILPAASIAADRARTTARAAEVRRAESQTLFHETVAEIPDVALMLGSRTDSSLREQGEARAVSLLERYAVLADAEWESRPAFALLEAEQQRSLKNGLGELLILMTRVELQKHAGDRARKWNELAGVMFAGSDAPAVVARHAAELAGGNTPPPESRHGMDYYFDGLDLAAAGRFREGLPLLARSCSLRPSHLQSWFVRGIAHDALNQPQDATAAFSVCIALKPDGPHAHLNRGLAHLKGRRAAEAEVDFTRALELKPDWLPARINRGIARDTLRKYREAEADFTAALADTAVPTRVWFLRARAKRFLADEPGYAADRAQGMKLEPTDAISFRTRATWLRAAREFDKALADFDSALKLNPADTDALLNKGIVLADDLHREADAIPVFDRLVELAPENADARCSRGVYHARLGHAAEARRDSADSLKADSSAYRLFQVAGLFAQLAKTDSKLKPEAVRHLARALRAGFNDPKLLSGDRDLDPIRLDPDVVKLLASVKQVDDLGK